MKQEASDSAPSAPPPAVAGVKAILRLLLFAVVVLFLWYLASGITRVPPGEVALVERFGFLQPQAFPPGLLVAWPPPIDRVIRLPGLQILEIELDEWRPRQEDRAEGETPGLIPRASLHPVRDGYSLTGDRNILQGRFVVRFRIADPVAYYLRSSNPETGLAGLVYQSIVKALASRAVDEVWAGERELVAAEIRSGAQVRADLTDLGVEILSVEIRELVPPVWVLPAFQEVLNAQVGAETFVEEALNDAARELPAAEATAFRLRGEAEIAAEALLAQARAEADSFTLLLQEASVDPGVFTRRHRDGAWREIFSRVRAKTLLPATPGGEIRLFLPGYPPASWDAGLPVLPTTPLDLEALEE
jgi:membrane protease subunit HflK